MRERTCRERRKAISKDGKDRRVLGRTNRKRKVWRKDKEGGKEQQTASESRGKQVPPLNREGRQLCKI